jgi:hypothetical protein
MLALVKTLFIRLLLAQFSNIKKEAKGHFQTMFQISRSRSLDFSRFPTSKRIARWC